MASKQKPAKGKKVRGKGATRRRRAKAKPPRRVSGVRRIPDEQGKRPKRADVGYGRPPVEHQFAPGQSGNPAGPPKARANLWRYFCRFLEMTPQELTKAVRDKRLTMAQRAAVKHVQQLVKKGLAGCGWLATKEAWDRDEGRASQHVTVETHDVLSPEECEEIRQAMKGV